MEKKILKHGNHKLDNDRDGYMYNFNTSTGQSFNTHKHNCYEFIHVIHGHLIYTVEGTDYLLSDGEFIMTNPNEAHSFRFPEEGDYQREFLHVYPDFIKGFPELVKGLNSRKSGYFNRFPAETVTKYSIDKLFRNMEECCANPTQETDYYMLGCTLLLIAKINEILRKEDPEPQIITVNKQANRISDYIDHHYDEDLTVESIAKAMYLSPQYLSRVFKAETGMTIKNYLNMRRIRRAKNLIMEGYSITNACMESGFGDYSTFYRVFVKNTGMSPDEFKRTNDDKNTAAHLLH